MMSYPILHETEYDKYGNMFSKTLTAFGENCRWRFKGSKYIKNKSILKWYWKHCPLYLTEWPKWILKPPITLNELRLIFRNIGLNINWFGVLFSCFLNKKNWPYNYKLGRKLIKHVLLLISDEINQYSMQSLSKGVARGGFLGCPWPPFCNPFLSKQPTTGGENAIKSTWQSGEYPHFDSVTPPLKNPAYAPAEFQIYWKY